jgi:apolipoprotein N-acyltransferase
MNTNTDVRAPRPIASVAVLLAGTLLVGFSMGRWLAPVAAWIGPVLIMRHARDHKGWRGYPLVIAAYILAFLIGFGSVWVGAGWPLPMVASLPVFYGLLWSLPFLADRLLGAQIDGFSSTFIFPLAATTIEFLNNHANPVGAWGMTGFTQYGNLPLMQFASVTGMIGITFLMGWFASVANWAWENRVRGSQSLRGLAAFGVVLAAVVVFGFLRLNLAPSGETVRVAGITADSNESFTERMQAAELDPTAPDLTPADLTAIRQIMESHYDAYFDATEREAHAGAKVILWDEMAGAVPVPILDEASLIARAQEVARQNGIYLAVPVGVFYLDTGEPHENKVMLIDPTGAIVIEHFKYGGAIIEGFQPGDRKLQTVDSPFGVLSGVVCYDMDYPAVVQQAGRNGTGLMLVPSRDWSEIDPVHSHMAVFRAIENGMSVVRQTDLGLSITVDPYGRVLAQTDYYGSTDRTMVAQVPARHVATIYTTFGRWFEWLCLAGFLYIVARVLVGRPVARI